MNVRVEALRPDLEGLWGRLFEAANVACFCNYWHFTGTKNEWLERCATAPNLNANEQSERIQRSEPAAQGLVARNEGGDVVGWMKLAPRVNLPRLRALPAYREASDVGLYAIGCFLVRPDARRQGVARALIAAIDDHVLAWGGTSVCAFPRRSAEPMHDEEAMMGPYRTLLAHGFREVGGEGPYPVLRKDLTSTSPVAPT